MDVPKEVKSWSFRTFTSCPAFPFGRSRKFSLVGVGGRPTVFELFVNIPSILSSVTCSQLKLLWLFALLLLLSLYLLLQHWLSVRIPYPSSPKFVNSVHYVFWKFIIQTFTFTSELISIHTPVFILFINQDIYLSHLVLSGSHCCCYMIKFRTRFNSIFCC